MQPLDVVCGNTWPEPARNNLPNDPELQIYLACSNSIDPKFHMEEGGFAEYVFVLTPLPSLLLFFREDEVAFLEDLYV